MNSYDDVKSFMRAGDQQVHNTPNISDDRVAQGTLYMKLIKESTGGNGEISLNEDKIIRRIAKNILIEK